jgi:tripartite-type tricarboxylate transporter receptor subunit TctC
MRRRRRRGHQIATRPDPGAKAADVDSTEETTMLLLRKALAALVLLPAAVMAQDFPNKPIRLIVPFAVGGAADTVGRSLGQQLSAATGQPVIVDNRIGANSMIGSEMVARAQPDGYTLLVQLGPPHNTLPFFSKAIAYDPIKDFTPIAIVGTAPQALVVNASLPIDDVQGLIAYARNHPGKLSYGTAGVGTSQHLGGELLKAVTRIDMVHVPYKGGSLALTDVVGGQVPVGILVLSNVMPFVKSGKLKLLAVLENQRAPAAPSVPTMTEAGVTGYTLPDTWVGVLGPAGMPADVVETLRAAIGKSLESADMRSRLDAAGFNVAKSASPADFLALLNSSVSVYRGITRQAGISPE